MEIVEPKVFLVGETQLVASGLLLYLKHIGAPEWLTDAPSEAEALVEVMGRACYRSYKPGMNPNVTQTREGNKAYLENIVKVMHGSVVEHAMINFIFCDVSRVFTHELVRHRAGTAISQESLRFVRVNKAKFWLPLSIVEHPEAMEIMVAEMKRQEEVQLKLAEVLKLDQMKDFKQKKKYTSAMRRVLGDGAATTIGWSANFRALRNAIELRTAPGAEEEIRLVFGRVAEEARFRYPNMFADYKVEMADGLPWWKTEFRKI